MSTTIKYTSEEGTEKEVNKINMSLGGDGGTVTFTNEGDKTYTLPVATSTTLGGVKPVAKTSAMTQSVGVDSSGALWANIPTILTAPYLTVITLYNSTIGRFRFFYLGYAKIYANIAALSNEMANAAGTYIISGCVRPTGSDKDMPIAASSANGTSITFTYYDPEAETYTELSIESGYITVYPVGILA